MRSFEEMEDEFYETCDPDTLPEVYEKYLDETNKMLENDSSNINIIKFKYFLLFLLERYEQCLEISNQLLMTTPNDIEILNNKAKDLYYLNKHKDSIEICQRILEIEPKNKEAIEQWNLVYLLAKDKNLPVPPKEPFDVAFFIYMLVTIAIGILCAMAIPLIKNFILSLI